MKKCTTCQVNKDESEYYPKRPNGLMATCKECNKKKAIEQRCFNKLLCLDYLGCFECQECGYDKCIGALDFHHNKGKKKFLISRIRNIILTDEQKIEISKCIVICANCHRKEHITDTTQTAYTLDSRRPHKVCPKCLIDKNTQDYYKNHGICKTCYNNLMIFKQRKRKEQCVIYKGGECCKCGETELPLLDFHHLNLKEKETGISKMVSKSFLGIKAELDKCILLCANCHREAHYFREILIDNFVQTDEVFQKIKTIEDEIFKFKTTLGKNQKSILIKKEKIIKQCDNCKKDVYKDKKLCRNCTYLQRRKFNPEKSELELIIKTNNSLEAVGRYYKVNSNSIRKRCLKLGINYKDLLGLEGIEPVILAD